MGIKCILYNTAKLQKKMQNRYARLVLNAHYMTPHSSMLSELAWHSVQQRIYYQVGLTMFKLKNGFLPEYLKNIIIPNKSTYCTRYNAHSTLFVRTPRTDYYKRSMHYYGSTLWNNLSPSVKTITSLYGFKKQGWKVLVLATLLNVLFI